MKRVGYLLFAVLAITLIFGGSAFAQVDNSAFYVTYYSNANTTGAPDATLRIINDGVQATTESEGVATANMYANIYVFDDSQELQECCSCFVSADGLLSESVDKNLTANELTGRAETSRGAIKVIASNSDDPAEVVQPKSGLHGWMTHVQAGATKTTWAVTEDPLSDSNLSAAELEALDQLCSFAITLGSGYGTCSCTPEDHDF